MTSRTWYLVRHGETAWNATSRMQGQWDSPLTAIGREHARASARLIGELGVDTVFASPLGRVRETVAIMQEALVSPVTYDDRLKEWSAGEWSGEFHADIPHKWPAEWAAWDADRYANRSPGGESFADLVTRARSFFEDAAGVSGSRVALIGHGFMNRALASVLLSLAPAETLAIRQANDTVIRVAVNGASASADHFVSGEGPFEGLPMASPASEP